MSRPQKLCQDVALVILIGLNKPGVLPIEIDSQNYITLKAMKCFFAL